MIPKLQNIAIFFHIFSFFHSTDIFLLFVTVYMIDLSVIMMYIFSVIIKWSLVLEMGGGVFQLLRFEIHVIADCPAEEEGKYTYTTDESGEKVVVVKKRFILAGHLIIRLPPSTDRLCY